MLRICHIVILLTHNSFGISMTPPPTLSPTNPTKSPSSIPTAYPTELKYYRWKHVPIDNTYSVQWSTVASSNNGKYLIVAATGTTHTYDDPVNSPAAGGIWFSQDYGKSWSMSNAPQYPDYSSIALSRSGKFGAVSSYSSGMFVSNDYGMTWTQDLGAAMGVKLTDTVISDDGKAIAVLSQRETYGQISANDDIDHLPSFAYIKSGDVWTNTIYKIVSQDRYELKDGSIAMSRNGSVIIATGRSSSWFEHNEGDFGVWRSIDYGTSWQPFPFIWVERPFVERIPSFGRSVAVSADASTIVVLAEEGAYVTTDGGDEWRQLRHKPPFKGPTKLVCSDDCQYLTASVVGAGLFLSRDFGDTWTHFSPPTDRTGWASVACDSFGNDVAAVEQSTGVWLAYADQPPPTAQPTERTTRGTAGVSNIEPTTPLLKAPRLLDVSLAWLRVAVIAVAVQFAVMSVVMWAYRWNRVRVESDTMVAVEQRMDSSDGGDDIPIVLATAYYDTSGGSTSGSSSGGYAQVASVEPVEPVTETEPAFASLPPPSESRAGAETEAEAQSSHGRIASASSALGKGAGVGAKSGMGSASGGVELLKESRIRSPPRKSPLLQPTLQTQSSNSPQQIQLIPLSPRSLPQTSTHPTDSSRVSSEQS